MKKFAVGSLLSLTLLFGGAQMVSAQDTSPGPAEDVPENVQGDDSGKYGLLGLLGLAGLFGLKRRDRDDHNQQTRATAGSSGMR